MNYISPSLSPREQYKLYGAFAPETTEDLLALSEGINRLDDLDTATFEALELVRGIEKYIMGGGFDKIENAITELSKESRGERKKRIEAVSGDLDYELTELIAKCQAAAGELDNAQTLIGKMRDDS